MVSAGRTSGAVRLDITVRESIRSTFEQCGSVDAVISATGKVKFAPFEDMRAADYEIGLEDKLMGQVDLVLIGRDSSRRWLVHAHSGVLDRDPSSGHVSLHGERCAERVRWGRRHRDAARPTHQRGQPRCRSKKRWRTTRRSSEASNPCPRREPPSRLPRASRAPRPDRSFVSSRELRQSRSPGSPGAQTRDEVHRSNAWDQTGDDGVSGHGATGVRSRLVD